jgi:hypothetical protein
MINRNCLRYPIATSAAAAAADPPTRERVVRSCVAQASLPFRRLAFFSRAAIVARLTSMWAMQETQSEVIIQGGAPSRYAKKCQGLIA